MPAKCWFLARLIFYSENEGDAFLRNVSAISENMATFITTAMRTSNPNFLLFAWLSEGFRLMLLVCSVFYVEDPRSVQSEVLEIFNGVYVGPNIRFRLYRWNPFGN